MAAPSYTYTLTNGTTADATQVQQNFTDILNGVIDGTKDLSINALTCAGTATLNGNVNLGNATSDDITFTGYVASSVLPKTTATSNLGSTTQTWSALYLDTAVTNGGTVYFNASSTSYLQSSADGATATLGGFTSLVASRYVIGTSSDSYAIEVNATGSQTIGVRSSSGSATVAIRSSNNTNYWSISSDSSNAGRLSFNNGNGGGSVIMLGAGGGNPDLSFRLTQLGAGTLSTNASGFVSSSSDMALKQDISPYYLGLEAILAISPSYYKWKEGTYMFDDVEYVGFIAQDVEENIPNAVFGIEGNKTLMDRPIIATLVNAVKELTARIVALEGA